MVETKKQHQTPLESVLVLRFRELDCDARYDTSVKVRGNSSLVGRVYPDARSISSLTQFYDHEDITHTMSESCTIVLDTV